MLSVSKTLTSGSVFLCFIYAELILFNVNSYLKKIIVVYSSEMNKARGIGKSPIAATAWHKCCTRFEV